MTQTMRIALLVLCTSVYLLFAPGRILFSDDEIVYQTTESLYERGDLVIAGIPKRSGEPKGRPAGTFGWAPGTDGKRYGFFGHGLSVVALPMYALGKTATVRTPETWRHAIRSDSFFLHRRSRAADWPRMLVSFTNCLVTALAVGVLAQWLLALGYSVRVGVTVALAYAFATSAWAYSRTFLSEPLSALMLLSAALGVTRFLSLRDERPTAARAWLIGAAALVGLSVHTHVLNVLAVPAYLVWLGLALRSRQEFNRHRTTMVLALLAGSVGLAMLGVSNHLRFGSPWETGRFAHYSHFVWPGEGVLAMLVAPGRSIFVYSPALLLAALGVRALARRHRSVLAFIVTMVALRRIFVGARSDWWGGWAIGPRFLLPLVPFMLVPLAEVLNHARDASRRVRLAIALAMAAAVALSMHLASHSIFEHMVAISRDRETPEYLAISHWAPNASPIAGFVGLKLDTLSLGALALSRHGHNGLLMVFVALAALAVLAAGVLGLGLWRTPPLARSSD
ncbi:MAG: hypothetical protein JKY37_29125 [Nannocystaceae bacterium]|nr:hypothetical protein [Nannocystaceae bacterium]